VLLLADDAEDNRIVYSALLEYAGFVVLLAENGAEAVAQARQHGPDLVLLDIAMPVMDGFTAAHILSADPQTAAIPKVAISAHDLDRGRLQAAGFCGYLQKPVEPRSLLQLVERCLHGGGAGGWIGLDRPAAPGPPA
jgi:two-component system, cell cycle response regulator DivK